MMSVIFDPKNHWVFVFGKKGIWWIEHELASHLISKELFPETLNWELEGKNIHSLVIPRQAPKELYFSKKLFTLSLIGRMSLIYGPSHLDGGDEEKWVPD